MKEPGWLHFDHKADIGIQGRGPAVSDAFAQAGLAVNAVIAELKTINQVELRVINCLESDPELLFFDYINEIINLISSEGMLFSRIEVNISKAGLEARLWGECIDQDRHDPAVEIKGASFNELCVKQEKCGQWVAGCIVDV